MKERKRERESERERERGAGGVTQYLSSKHKVLSSNPSPAKREERGRKRERERKEGRKTSTMQKNLKSFLLRCETRETFTFSVQLCTRSPNLSN
jgi:hypothetical protein